ncbi:TIGR03862 family flavoprotein [Pontivivens insulae]|uniref:Thiazole biosynthetic enzyme n=1 Tax=Pontivivens insulae TaxID=1639689 RepID=A0A2R8A794_9RHOB|nr:TIGR03862 family flavoprotein [Pontivivens insulae]RED18211.1 hypothetical protein DFR53_0406 [Pontivivens insulae]SPF28109.1 Putative thiazole biosynthetic enzyme [Pontivivens insulae]
MPSDLKVDVLVVGAGPAGLAAAEVASAQGARVLVVERMPSIARKLLMAGKSGLNITKDASVDHVIEACGRPWLAPMLRAFGPQEVQDWMRGLGQEIFTGSSGRVFPVAMKASPLVRAWAKRLEDQGVQLWTRAVWQGFDVPVLTEDGPRQVIAKSTIFAMGGASWARLGSDGAWAKTFQAEGIDLAPFQPANMGFDLRWSEPMLRHAGTPVKAVRVMAAGAEVSGEFVITERGIEGSAIYAISAAVREAMGTDGLAISLDLAPDRSLDALTGRLSRPRGKMSQSNYLRKATGLQGVKMALLREGGPLPQEARALAERIKAVPLMLRATRPLDEAISVAGGVTEMALDRDLSLRARPGVFCAGEMLDWEAPTGGYLLTACLATGRWAGAAAARFAAKST